MHIDLNGTDWRIMGLMPTEWVWRKVGTTALDAGAATPPWFPATVPGDVQSDLMDAGEIPVFWRDLHSRECEWTSQRDWVYEKRFAIGPEAAGKRAILRFESVDHACHVLLNGTELGAHTGAYTPFELDATEALNVGEENTLVVVVEHAPAEPEVQGQIGWTSRIRQWKPRFAYAWDWCTRLVPLGIIGDARLILADRARLTDVWVRPVLREGRSACDVHVAADVKALGGEAVGFTYELTVGEPLWPVAEGRLDADGRATIVIERPELWWPNGSGEQTLYRVTVQARAADGTVLDERTVRFGVRSVRAVPNDDAPDGALPYVLEINGVRTFLRGWNWAPIDQLYGREHEKQYRHAIRMARDAHCNFLRVWGGGLLERELFYDLCDEAGIMVWQEFFQSSSGIDNEPPSDPEYVAYARSQAEQVVPLRRNHPSLVIWCGGNELFGDDQIPLTIAHPAIGALAEVVARLDPDRIFLPASPSGPVFAALPENAGRMHDVHGHWIYQGDGKHYDFFNRIDPLLHSEFGVEGAANLETLRRFVSEEHLWPPDRTNPVWVHHGAWWLNRPAVEELFGPIDSVDDYVRASQWVQAEGLRYAVEASRRRKWRTAGCMPWQFNEAWPNVSCTNALDYFGHPKPAYWAMRNAYAPVAVSARYDRLQWEPGATFEAEIWLNAAVPLDAPGAGWHVPAAHERARLRLEWSLHEVLTGDVVSSGAVPVPEDFEPPAAIHLCAAHASLPENPALFALCLRVIAAQTSLEWCAARNSYIFSTGPGAPLAPLLRIPATSRIAVSTIGERPARAGYRLTADGPLVNLALTCGEDHAGPHPDLGYVMYQPPHEEVGFGIVGSGTVRVSAWNAPAVELRVP